MRWALLLWAVSVLAQETGSVRGTVRDLDGAAMAGVRVDTNDGQTMTDDEGRYSFANVRTGRVRLQVGLGGEVTRSVRIATVAAGQDVTVDFAVARRGSISGRVTDVHHEPVTGVEVVLMGREFGGGLFRDFRRTVARTDDQGNYRLEGVQPGVAYRVLVLPVGGRLEPMSEAPDDPRLRRPAPVPTYFPGVDSVAAATAITLRPGEDRTGVDIEVRRAPSYCAEALLTESGRPAALRFQVYETDIPYGLGPSGGTTGLPPMGTSGADGRIRVCDLHPGDYRLVSIAGDLNAPDSMAVIPFSITNRDVRGLTLQPVPGIDLGLEVVWAGAVPERAPEGKVRISLQSMTRSFGAHGGMREGVAPPGMARIEGPRGGAFVMDDYYARVLGMTGALYAKRLVYGNDDVLRAPLRLGSAPAGAGLRLEVGHDGAGVRANVVDRDGRTVPFGVVAAIPAGVATDEDLAARVIVAEADQNGEATVEGLEPGKWLFAAMVEAPGLRTPEFAARLRALAGEAQEADLGPRAEQELTLTTAQ